MYLQLIDKINFVKPLVMAIFGGMEGNDDDVYLFLSFFVCFCLFFYVQCV